MLGSVLVLVVTGPVVLAGQVHSWTLYGGTVAVAASRLAGWKIFPPLMSPCLWPHWSLWAATPVGDLMEATCYQCPVCSLFSSQFSSGMVTGVDTHTCTCVHAHTRVHAHTHTVHATHMYTHATHMYTHAHTDCICAYVHYTHVCTHMYMHM